MTAAWYRMMTVVDYTVSMEVKQLLFLKEEKDDKPQKAQYKKTWSSGAQLSFYILLVSLLCFDNGHTLPDQASRITYPL